MNNTTAKLKKKTIPEPAGANVRNYFPFQEQGTNVTLRK